jgi:hypothetical protein
MSWPAGVPAGGDWLDGDETRVVRPYAVTRGRTAPAMDLDLLTLVVATGSVPGSQLGPNHERIVGLCSRPLSVAEIAARLRLPVTAAKILLADLAGQGTLRTSAPPAAEAVPDILERVLSGLQNRL